MLAEQEKAKAVGQFKLQLNNIMQPFMKYGFQQDHELPAAMDEITELAILLAKRYTGIDEQISLDIARRKAEQRRSRKR